MFNRKITRFIFTAVFLFCIGCDSTPKQNKTITWESAPWKLQQDSKPIISQPHTFINFTNL
jgi:hypothetical protein